MVLVIGGISEAKRGLMMLMVQEKEFRAGKEHGDVECQ